MIASVSSHVCTLAVPDVILVGWIDPMSALRSVPCYVKTHAPKL